MSDTPVDPVVETPTEEPLVLDSKFELEAARLEESLKPKEEPPVVEISTTEPVSKELTEVEKEAIAAGWKPDGKKSAEWWMETGQFINKLKESQDKIKGLEKSLQDVVAYQQVSIKEAYNKAYEDLKTQMQTAASLGDVDAVLKLNEQILDIKSKEPLYKPVAQTPVVSEDLVKEQKREAEAFMVRNPWYVHNSADPTIQTMVLTANAKEQELIKTNPNLLNNPRECLRLVEDHMRSVFPSKFKNTAAEAPPIVAKADVTPVKTQEKGFDSLTDYYKNVYKALAKEHNMSKEDFLTEMKREGIL